MGGEQAAETDALDADRTTEAGIGLDQVDEAGESVDDVFVDVQPVAQP